MMTGAAANSDTAADSGAATSGSAATNGDTIVNADAELAWHRVAELDEIPALGARVVRVGERSIALFRNSADEVFALLDRCPHRGGPLSQGIVHGSCVTCPLHDWVIDLATGEVKGPDEGRAERFPVRLEAGTVLLALAR